MNKRAALLITLAFCFVLNSSPATDVESELRGILDLQKAAWNDRNLDGFMAYYWNSEDFTFQSGAQRLRGFRALLERYRKSYSGEHWGKLDFTDLEVKPLAEDCAYVLGRWRLELKEPREGVFTIIFRRFAEGWRIIHDHTS